MTALEGRLAAMTAEADVLRAAVARAESEVEGYMLMVGGRVEVRGEGRYGVKMLNAGAGRCLEFVLDGGGKEGVGEVEYRPRRIDMGGMAYPTELKGAMWFKAERAPNFTRYLLSLLYKKEEGGEEGEGEKTKAAGEESEKAARAEGETAPAAAQ